MPISTTEQWNFRRSLPFSVSVCTSSLDSYRRSAPNHNRESTAVTALIAVLLLSLPLDKMKHRIYCLIYCIRFIEIRFMWFKRPIALQTRMPWNATSKPTASNSFSYDPVVKVWAGKSIDENVSGSNHFLIFACSTLSVERNFICKLCAEFFKVFFSSSDDCDWSELPVWMALHAFLGTVTFNTLEINSLCSFHFLFTKFQLGTFPIRSVKCLTQNLLTKKNS